MILRQNHDTKITFNLKDYSNTESTLTDTKATIKKIPCAKYIVLKQKEQAKIKKTGKQTMVGKCHML